MATGHRRDGSAARSIARRGAIPFPIIVAVASLGAGALTWHAAPLAEAAWASAKAAPVTASAVPAPGAEPEIEAPAGALSSVFYRGCREARAAGAAPIRRGSPGYREEMDGDGDGIACEDYGSGGFTGRRDRVAVPVSSGWRRRGG